MASTQYPVLFTLQSSPMTNAGASAAHQKLCCRAAAADASPQIANRRKLRSEVLVLSILLLLLLLLLDWSALVECPRASVLLLTLLPALRRGFLVVFAPPSLLLLKDCIRCCGMCKFLPVMHERASHCHDVRPLQSSAIRADAEDAPQGSSNDAVEHAHFEAAAAASDQGKGKLRNFKTLAEKFSFF